MFKSFYEKKLKADYYTEDLRKVDWQIFKDKGIKLIFLDIDNTLAKHGSRKPDSYALEVIKILYSYDFKLCILSNARSNRIEEYAAHLKVDSMENARKPSPKKLIDKLEELNVDSRNSVLAGDQLFTDIWAGNNANCLTILVKQRFEEEAFQVRLKRRLERYFFKKYGSSYKKL